MTGGAGTLERVNERAGGVEPAPAEVDGGGGGRRIGRAILVAILAAIAVYGTAGYLSARVSWLPGSEAHAATPLSLDVPGRVASGALSVHTQRSHDSQGSFEELARAARRTGLDFVVVGDHPAPESGGWSPAIVLDSVLVVAGEELILSGMGRITAFGLPEAVDRTEWAPAEFWELAAASDALVYVVHGRSPRVRESWHSATVGYAHGWEVLDVSEAGRRAWSSPWRLYHLSSLLAGALTGKFTESLLRLDRLGFAGPAVLAFDSLTGQGDRRITALAGLNHHSVFSIRGRAVPGYEAFFRTLVNHVILPIDLPHDPDEALRTLGDGIRNGEVFLSSGDAAAAAGFRVKVRDPTGNRARMGGELPLNQDLRLHTTALEPRGASVLYRVVRDGRPAGNYRAVALDLPIDQPGTYRIEAYRYSLRIGPLFLNLRPWIFANPVRIAPDRPAPDLSAEE